MKPWGHGREQVAALRAHIVRRWRVESDSEMALSFGFSREYVAKTRRRMGLVKSLGVVEILMHDKRQEAKKKRATSLIRAHRPMSNEERLARHELRMNKRAEEKQGVGRPIEEVMREYGGVV